MKRGLFGLIGAVSLAGSGLAWGSSPVEKVVCTEASRTAWASEAQARAKFGTDQFILVKFKVSRGNCYEFYAVASDGSVVEAYYDPVTLEAKRYNRVRVESKQETRYESSRTRP